MLIGRIQCVKCLEQFLTCCKYLLIGSYNTNIRDYYGLNCVPLQIHMFKP